MRHGLHLTNSIVNIFQMRCNHKTNTTMPGRKNNVMQFHSILFEYIVNEESEENYRMPDFFIDLNMDQIIKEVLQGREEYKLDPFFYRNLTDVSAINYRLAVMKDLENPNLLNSIVIYSLEMKKVREFVGFSQNLHNKYQREKWLLDGASIYCNAILNLYQALSSMDLNSKGLKLFNDWLTKYINSDYYILLSTETTVLQKEIGSIKYSIQVESDKVVINSDDNENDYCALINSTFEVLNEVAFSYQINFLSGLEMCSLETQILEIVRKMNIATFNKLDTYAEKHSCFLDNTIKAFDREIQFYISYLEYMRKLKQKGLNFAYPDVSDKKNINILGGYDLALGYKLLDSTTNIVCNDFYLDKEERICILTGPNQGGKTTFARAFGQIQFLASIGCPVPCQKADLFIFDNLFTHFSLEENLSTNAGRLKEELTRLNQVLKKATTDSIIIINELFATTTSHDAYTMGKRILDHFFALDCICLYVTHIYELTLINTKTVSLVATVDLAEGSVRTYKITRKAADGVAYANSIVEKYNLTYSQIKERIRI
jgi:DNA mismatch repair protein MutS